jgi:predicted RNA-binding Zn-ribbon protein involved in translation (DUF1610 family)
MPAIVITQKVTIVVELTKYFCPWCGKREIFHNFHKDRDEDNMAMICANCSHEFYLESDPLCVGREYVSIPELKERLEDRPGIVANPEATIEAAKADLDSVLIEIRKQDGQQT